MDTVISHKELLLCQKRDRFCRKLVRTAGRHSDFMINHEGLLIKQVSILRNTYRVRCTTKFSAMSDQNISQQQRSSGFIRFRRLREQVNTHVNKCLLCCQHATHEVKYKSKHLPILNKPFDGICLDCVGLLERSKQGFKWILTCIDLHSSFLIAVPMKSKSADDVIHAYIKPFYHK